ncbi:ribbon-helix-helix protein, CopG family [Paludisphaera rhizosphaerae]|uniref:ribbon-helix-helix protein, CopG family n=1 Tax=Paludisphaera rhizosphaerae TaxID=2711216 RepID=UPI0013EAFFD2|nr:ribbon-helix-helix protein, CopG family [Paludisphaera rhizosphaerae]
MTTSERVKLNYSARDGRPTSLYLDVATLELLERIQRVENMRNRSSAVRLAVALWAEQQEVK